GATSYRIYWGTEDAVTTGSEYGGETTDTAFLHTGVLQGWTYYYRVASVNAAGEGPLSPTVFASPAPDQPDYTDPTTGMQFVYVPPGTFQMGDTFGDCARYGWCGYEQPVHTVTLTRGYYLGKTEVTQAQWQAVMGSNPSYFQPSRGYPACPTCPVEQVSWNDIQVFVANLNAQTGRAYRLPTEAEWEYAAKGGPYSQGYKYAGSNNVDEVGSNRGSVYGTHPVGQKLPNELGLYDMSGNVWEWVQDWWGTYSAAAQTDPTGPTTGSRRVFRGGSWLDDPWFLRSAFRLDRWPGDRSNLIGLRLVLPQ
ncbi:MAG: formylglycine-generating enzyme family protein, partial [Deferrisomatales bacterium]